VASEGKKELTETTFEVIRAMALVPLSLALGTWNGVKMVFKWSSNGVKMVFKGLN
jgi:hypothetical protein